MVFYDLSTLVVLVVMAIVVLAVVGGFRTFASWRVEMLLNPRSLGNEKNAWPNRTWYPTHQKRELLTIEGRNEAVSSRAELSGYEQRIVAETREKV